MLDVTGRCGSARSLACVGLAGPKLSLSLAFPWRYWLFRRMGAGDVEFRMVASGGWKHPGDVAGSAAGLSGDTLRCRVHWLLWGDGARIRLRTGRSAGEGSGRQSRDRPANSYGRSHQDDDEKQRPPELLGRNHAG